MMWPLQDVATAGCGHCRMWPLQDVATAGCDHCRRWSLQAHGHYTSLQPEARVEAMRLQWPRPAVITSCSGHTLQWPHPAVATPCSTKNDKVLGPPIFGLVKMVAKKLENNCPFGQF